MHLSHDTTIGRLQNRRYVIAPRSFHAAQLQNSFSHRHGSATIMMPVCLLQVTVHSERAQLSAALAAARSLQAQLAEKEGEVQALHEVAGHAKVRQLMRM